MRFLVVLAMTAAATLSGSAVAKPLKSDFSPALVRTLTLQYATCVIGTRAPLAWRIMRDDPGNRAIMRQYPEIVVESCARETGPFGVNMRFPGDIYIYSLAEALFQKFLASEPVPNLAAAPPLMQRPLPVLDEAQLPKEPKKAAVIREKFQQALGSTFLSHFGACVARKDAVGAYKLLKTKMDSSDETVAFNALMPTLSVCLGDGTTLKFGKPALRGAIALGYVRLADALAPTRFPVARGRDDV